MDSLAAAPLLVKRDSNGDGEEQEKKKKKTTTAAATASFLKDAGDESKRMWQLAGPAIFTAVCQYSLGALTQTFAGFVSELDLAAVSVENSVVAGLAYGVMVCFY